MRGVLVLDFDGTLCLGDGPVVAYALAVAEEAGAVESDVLDPILAFLDGDDTAVPGAADGYQAAAVLGRAHGLDDDGLSRAYRASRATVDAGEVELRAPEGIVAELAAWSAWHRVLVTNAPLVSTTTLLARLGLSDSVDAVIGDAGKPAGLERLLGDGDALSWRAGVPLFSVGDIWRNDLAPVAARGGVTGLIERHAQPEAAPTVRATSIQEVFSGLRGYRDGTPTAT